jgi:hypothetical protein
MHLESFGPTISHNQPVVNFRVDDLTIIIRIVSGARREPINYWDLEPFDETDTRTRLPIAKSVKAYPQRLPAGHECG